MLGSRERPVPGPTYMSREQKGQQSHMSHYTPPHSPETPSKLRQTLTYQEASSQNAHTADYLRDLRKGNVSRPSGSRPPPPSRFSGLRRAETQADLGEHSIHERPPLPTSSSLPIMPAQALSHGSVGSSSSPKALFAGRPLVRAPSTSPLDESQEEVQDNDPDKQQRCNITYVERGTRWMEKQETKSIRMAMEDMDLEEEKRVHSSAQDEAAELVWKHQNADAAGGNPAAPYRNPDLPRDYRSHLRKGSYQRSHSQDALEVISQRSTSGGSQKEGNDLSISSKRRSVEASRKISPPSGTMNVKKKRTPSGKSFGGLAEAVADDIVKAHRRVSSGSKRILSGEKKMFMHPNDRIWEDPQEQASSKTQAVDPPNPTANVPTAHIRKNPFARVRMQAAKLERSQSEPIVTAPMHHGVEVQRNSPSQLRRPWYTANEPLSPTLPSPKDESTDDVPAKTTPTKGDVEVRGDDIRAATSKSRKDYSPKLPRPTMVSDKPGRPIVSFAKDWKPKPVVLEEQHAAPLAKPTAEPSKTIHNSRPAPPSPSPLRRAQTANIPQICVDECPRPPIPTINIPCNSVIPSIVLPEASHARSAPVVPAINVEPPSICVEPPSTNVSDVDCPSFREKPSTPHSRPTPARPLPRHAATSPIPRSTPHYSPSPQQSGALCAQCALPIAGRILSAGGERFHPSCFVCNSCHTNLELVAFYPEPDKKRSARIERIAARQTGELPEGMEEEDLYRMEIDDGDETLRFFCHLDFHELFSPRCKSCKTPIEGEVIVACGAEWHVGHFFCAQCGDPFDSTTPFVEKDNYAWCVGCHTNRYSSKCRKCKKPVTDTVLKALGHDWHGRCFVCTECSGDFEDGKFFLRGESQDPVCVKCEEKRLKA